MLLKARDDLERPWARKDVSEPGMASLVPTEGTSSSLGYTLIEVAGFLNNNS